MVYLLIYFRIENRHSTGTIHNPGLHTTVPGRRRMLGAPDIPDVPGMRICQQRQIYRVQQLQRPDKKPLRR